MRNSLAPALMLMVLLLILISCSTPFGAGPDSSRGEDVLLFPDLQQADSTSLPDLPEGGDKDAVAPDLIPPVDIITDTAPDLPLMPDVQDLFVDDMIMDNQIDIVEPDQNPDPDQSVEIDTTEPATEEGMIDEFFDDNTMANTDETTALWGIGGALTPQATGFGDGSDGEFSPMVDTVLNTADAPFQYTSFHLPANVVVTALGDSPLEIRVQGEAVIEGTISVSGGDGEDALDIAGGSKPLGGEGVGGGAHGGNGGPGGTEAGLPGQGTGGGQSGLSVDVVTFVGPGGGGGFGADGMDGEDFTANNANSGLGGSLYGTPDLLNIEGGSGGGGGGPRDNTPNDPTASGDGIINAVDNPGAGGGAGGGALVLRVGGAITVAGRIIANGGDGGMGDFSGGGGGGSGGAILLETSDAIVMENGVLSARGGVGNICTDTNQLKWCLGGLGSGGRIVLRTGIPVTDGLVMNPDPVPTWGPPVGPIDGGTGTDGDFAPLVDTELNTSGGPFFYTSVSIPEGVTITAVGNQALQIYSQGNVDIHGTIDVSGFKGGNAESACCSQPGPPLYGEGGLPGPGGYRGGAGSLDGDAEDGLGSGGGTGSHAGGFAGSPFAGGGAGAGYGSPGQVGGCPEEAAGGTIYGVHSLEPLQGGSGGGGAGACDVAGTNPGSGGGGGGGAMQLQCGGMLLMQGTLRANGGVGGDNGGSGSGGSFGSGGGGGSGGAILVRSQSVRDFGTYEALGGPAGDLSQGGGCSTTANVPGQGRGGAGGKGRIRFETSIPVGFVFPEEGTLNIDSLQTTFAKTAVSLFYDSGVECPDFQEPVTQPVDMIDSLGFHFEGAHALNNQPDPATYTGWLTAVNDVDCYRFIRYSVVFDDWNTADPAPTLEHLTIPFTYSP
jgi:hypothetical protein